MSRLAMLPDTFWVAVVEQTGRHWWSGPYAGPDGQVRANECVIDLVRNGAHAVVVPVPK